MNKRCEEYCRGRCGVIVRWRYLESANEALDGRVACISDDGHGRTSS